MTIEGAASGSTAPGEVGAWLERAVTAALDEDLGGHGAEADVTTRSTVPEDASGTGHVLVKQDGVICGLGALGATFGALDPSITVALEATDGDEVGSGTVVARVTGPVRPILSGERVALNLIGHLSGIATLTAAFVRSAPDVQISDTRKTLPGLRALEKYAVLMGGGVNHRFALWDGVLVKDNHVAAAGGVAEATRRARGSTTLPVQVECTSRLEVADALDAGAPAILLDNRSPEELRELVAYIRERASGVLIEASGGVTLDDVVEVAATGVDRISVGALTHSAPALDVSMRLAP